MPFRMPLNLPHKYILAPMVGASELAFRQLCRKYGAQLAYTPMMSAHKFAFDDAEFQTCPADRPLVCHFSAYTVADFVAAA
jgi:tRNA-dihydrouridine synthase 1